MVPGRDKAGEDECGMQDLSALTPPLLMFVVVVIAIVAFLRHEMNRSRSDKRTPGEKMSTSPQRGDDDRDDQQLRDLDARRTTSGDT
jgi:hypothetical protein